MLGTLDGVQASPAPVWVRLDADLQQAHGAHCYPDPAVAADSDEAGMRIAMAAIEGRFLGSEVEEMPHNNPGFDVRILDDDGVAIAYVEVKSTATPDRVFFLSETERRFGERQADRYHLVLVTSVVAEPSSGDVHWHDGPLSDASVCLEPRQWKGVLLA